MFVHRCLLPEVLSLYNCHRQNDAPTVHHECLFAILHYKIVLAIYLSGPCIVAGNCLKDEAVILKKFPHQKKLLTAKNRRVC
jgi:hypothetical protein